MHRFACADQVIAVAQRVNHREVTHYQGRAERRTRWNTPVQGLAGRRSWRAAGTHGRRRSCGTVRFAGVRRR
jgi:hypothetical protein